MLALAAGGLLWLNGPGLRWLAPKVAARWFQQTGARITFSLEGSLTGGITVADLHLQHFQSLDRLTVRRVTPIYQLRELAAGRLQGLEIDGLHVELRLAADDGKPATGGKPPLDPQQLAQTLRSVRGRLVPLAIDLKDISLDATRGGKPVLALAASRLHHGAGDPAFDLQLGAITDAMGRVWPAQQATLAWRAEDLRIERIDPLPGVSVRNFVLQLPASGAPAAETQLRIADAVFEVSASPGFATVTADLREGQLHSAQLTELFALKLPAKAALTSFSVCLADLLPDPSAATGTARLLLEEIAADGWTVPELGLGVELEANRCALAASGRMLESGFALQAEAPLTRAGGWRTGDVQGHFKVADVPKVIAGLAARFPAIDPAAAVPPAALDGDFSVAMTGLRPGSATVKLSLQPADPDTAAPITLSGRWLPDQPVAAELASDGLQATAQYQPAPASYQADVRFDRFDSTRLDRWLAIVRAQPGATVSLTGAWHGRGEVPTGSHRGTLALARAEWSRAGSPAVRAEGGIDYNWPGGFVTNGLRLQAKEQTITVDASLAAGMLELRHLRWQDRGTEIGGGSASLPVPGNFARWRDTLAHDPRPLAVALESKVHSLALLKDWLPAAALLDARSTGRMQIKVAGTYAQPAADVVVRAEGAARAPTTATAARRSARHPGRARRPPDRGRARHGAGLSRGGDDRLDAIPPGRLGGKSGAARRREPSAPGWICRGSISHALPRWFPPRGKSRES